MTNPQPSDGGFNFHPLQTISKAFDDLFGKPKPVRPKDVAPAWATLFVLFVGGGAVVGFVVDGPPGAVIGGLVGGIVAVVFIVVSMF